MKNRKFIIKKKNQFANKNTKNLCDWWDELNKKELLIANRISNKFEEIKENLRNYTIQSKPDQVVLIQLKINKIVVSFKGLTKCGCGCGNGEYIYNSFDFTSSGSDNIYYFKFKTKLKKCKR